MSDMISTVHVGCCLTAHQGVRPRQNDEARSVVSPICFIRATPIDSPIICLPITLDKRCNDVPIFKTGNQVEIHLLDDKGLTSRGHLTAVLVLIQIQDLISHPLAIVPDGRSDQLGIPRIDPYGYCRHLRREGGWGRGADGIGQLRVLANASEKLIVPQLSYPSA